VNERSHPHSRATGAVRLGVALWLVVSSIVTFADPQRAVTDQAMPMGTLLPLAGLSFTLGIFLLTGFMSRVCGLLLVCLGMWQVVTFGFTIIPTLLAIIGLYFMLRGGGAWAMDIYVQKMQDKARRKAALSSPESL
jgi:hypothetical protein